MVCNNADQLSTDKVPMGGFNMGKGVVMWPVPDSVTDGAFGKNKNPTVDGLNILWKNMAIHLKCHTTHDDKFQCSIPYYGHMLDLPHHNMTISSMFHTTCGHIMAIFLT